MGEYGNFTQFSHGISPVSFRGVDENNKPRPGEQGSLRKNTGHGAHFDWLGIYFLNMDMSVPQGICLYNTFGN